MLLSQLLPSMVAFSCCMCISCLSSFLFFFPDNVMFALGLELKPFHVTGIKPETRDRNHSAINNQLINKHMKTSSSVYTVLFRLCFRVKLNLSHPLLQVMDGDQTVVHHGADDLTPLLLLSTQNTPPLEKVPAELLQQTSSTENQYTYTHTYNYRKY